MSLVSAAVKTEDKFVRTHKPFIAGLKDKANGFPFHHQSLLILNPTCMGTANLSSPVMLAVIEAC
jgi:hypothetical protein